MVGGLTSTASDGLPTGYLSVEDQKAALTYLMSESISGLDMFADPDLLAEFRPVGGLEGADAMARNAPKSNWDTGVISCRDADARRQAIAGEIDAAIPSGLKTWINKEGV